MSRARQNSSAIPDVERGTVPLGGCIWPPSGVAHGEWLPRKASTLKSMQNNDLSPNSASQGSPEDLFIDASRGVAGDMLLAALVNSGISEDVIREPLAEILPPHRIEFVTENRRGIVGLGARVTTLEDSPPHRTLPDLLKALEHPILSDGVRQKAEEVYRRLAKAEAAVHGIPEEKVHFHEVGAIDAQVDILGVLLAIESISPRRISCTSLPLGQGQVRAAHGLIPVPAPAVVELLRGAKVHAGPIGRELTTPTGAALLMSLASEQMESPKGTLLNQGWGFGQRVAPEDDPVNGVRLLRLHGASPTLGDEVLRMETVIDHISGEDLGGIVDRCLEAGALEAFLTPIQMKKSRPGHQLTVLARPGDEATLCAALHRWTGTLGIRIDSLRRSVLKRESVSIEACGETVRFKLAWYGHDLISSRPEQQDVSRLAESRNWSVDHTRQQLASAIDAYLAKSGKSRKSTIFGESE